MGNKKKFWSKNNGRNLGILIIIIAILPAMTFLGLIVFVKMTYPPPETYDFSIYSGHVAKVEIVDWINSNDQVSPDSAENYRVILTLEESQIPDLLNTLSEVEFNWSSPEDGHDEFGGRCFLITLDDGSYRIIGRYGYARFALDDDDLERYTRHNVYIHDYDFDDLYAPYLGR
jgi:hypothetical protein